MLASACFDPRLPAPGHELSRYEANAQPPVLGFDAKGTLALHAKTQGSVERGTLIYLLDQKAT